MGQVGIVRFLDLSDLRFLLCEVMGMNLPWPYGMRY